MNHFLLVTKRNGKTERINLDKIERVLGWAAEGLSGVKPSRIERGHFPISARAIASAVTQSLMSLAEYIVVPTIIGDIKSGHLIYLTPSMQPPRKSFVKLLTEVCKLPRSPPFENNSLQSYSRGAETCASFCSSSLSQRVAPR
nr:hypothetical protein [Enterobacter kobei]